MKYCGNYLNLLQFPNSKKNSFCGNCMRKYGRQVTGQETQLQNESNVIIFQHQHSDLTIVHTLIGIYAQCKCKCKSSLFCLKAWIIARQLSAEQQILAIWVRKLKICSYYFIDVSTKLYLIITIKHLQSPIYNDIDLDSSKDPTFVVIN